MLTGRETVPATFAATAHLHRAQPAVVEVGRGTTPATIAWGALFTEVRRIALALVADGAGAGDEVDLDPAATRRERSVTFLVASVVGAVVGVGQGGRAGSSAPDLGRLATAGAALDERHPDRFEALVAARSPGDALLRRGDVVHTHATLLVAARSLAQAGGLGGADRLCIELTAGSAVEVVAGLLVPCLTGAQSWSVPERVQLDDLPPADRPTFVATGASGARTAPGPAISGRRRGRRQPPTPRLVVVAGDGGGPLDTTGAGGGTALAVEAAGGLVTGFGRAGTLGRPLPGVSVAVDDDGAVLVAAASVAAGAPGLRADGWLDTGLHGNLDDGHLVLDIGPTAADGASDRGERGPSGPAEGRERTA